MQSGWFCRRSFLGGCPLLQPAADDPVLVKLGELEKRMQNIERVMQNQSLVELSQQVNSGQRRGDEMQGRIEELEHGAESTAERQRQLYLDLDSRIQEIEAAMSARSRVGVMDGGALPPGELPVPGGSASENYKAALELLRAERHEPAAAAFEQFLVAFPDSELAGNAQYWLAETHYVTKMFEQALSEFKVVIDRYPQSGKVPDALLKMGYCNYELKRFADARVALTRVADEYSRTVAARLAGQRLKRMDEDGI